MESAFDSIIEKALLVFVAGLPLIFYPSTFNRFDLPKSVFLLLVVAIILAVWVTKIILTQRVTINRTPLDLPVVFFFLVIFIASALSFNRLESWVGSSFAVRKEPLPIWIAYLIIFFAATNFMTDSAKKLRLVKVTAVISLLISIFAIIQSLGFGLFYADKPAKLQVSSTLGSPIYAGAYLTLVIPIIFAFFIVEANLFKKILYALLGSFTLSALVLTYNRGSWIGTLTGVCVFLILGLVRETSRMRARLAIFLIAVVVVVLFAGAVLPKIAPRTLSFFTSRKSGLELSGTALKRALILQSTLLMLRDHPLFGWGPETYRDVFPRYQKLSLIRLETEKPLTADRPHSQFMYIAYAFGLIGLAVYLWIFAIVLSSVSNLSGVFSNQGKLLKIGILSSLIAYAVQEQFSFSTASVTPLFWVLLGIYAHSYCVNQIWFSFRMAKVIRLIIVFLVALAAVWVILLSTRVMVADHFYHLGRQSAAQGELARSVNYYKKAISFNPFENAFRFSYGIISRELAFGNQDVAWLENAISIVKAGLKQNPSSYDLYLVLGDLYYSYALLQGHVDYSDARWAYAKAVQNAPNYSYAYLGIGHSLLAEGKNQEAVRYFEKALSITPSLWQAWYSLGQAHKEMGDKLGAIRDFEKVLKINPTYKPAQEELRQLKSDG